jgi:hypothetical protein
MAEKFPFDEVVDTIEGRNKIPSHERIQMPFLGTTLQKPGQERSSEEEDRSDGSVRRESPAEVTQHCGRLSLAFYNDTCRGALRGS